MTSQCFSFLPSLNLKGLYPGRIVDVNLQLDPLWIYEYTNRVREKVNICTGNDDNNTPGWQPGDEVIVNCHLMGESREDFIDYQFATYAVYTETKGGVYKWKLDSKRQLCVKRTVYFCPSNHSPVRPLSSADSSMPPSGES